MTVGQAETSMENKYVCYMYRALHCLVHFGWTEYHGRIFFKSWSRRSLFWTRNL